MSNARRLAGLLFKERRNFPRNSDDWTYRTRAIRKLLMLHSGAGFADLPLPGDDR